MLEASVMVTLSSFRQPLVGLEEYENCFGNKFLVHWFLNWPFNFSFNQHQQEQTFKNRTRSSAQKKSSKNFFRINFVEKKTRRQSDEIFFLDSIQFRKKRSEALFIKKVKILQKKLESRNTSQTIFLPERLRSKKNYFRWWSRKPWQVFFLFDDKKMCNSRKKRFDYPRFKSTLNFG